MTKHLGHVLARLNKKGKQLSSAPLEITHWGLAHIGLARYD